MVESNLSPRPFCEQILSGPLGFGWYTEVIRTWTEASESGEMAVFVDINLFVKKDGEWSRPIFGNGGNKLIANEKKYDNGQTVYVPYLDDDAYKKAYTDAISVAAKALGVGLRTFLGFNGNSKRKLFYGGL